MCSRVLPGEVTNRLGVASREGQSRNREPLGVDGPGWTLKLGAPSGRYLSSPLHGCGSTAGQRGFSVECPRAGFAWKRDLGPGIIETVADLVNLRSRSRPNPTGLGGTPATCDTWLNKPTCWSQAWTRHP